VPPFAALRTRRHGAGKSSARSFCSSCFDAYLHAQHIPHRWSYPRCPRINGCIERYQRTLSEEFIQVHQDSIRQPQEFLHHLADYLWFYNSGPIHSALGNQTLSLSWSPKANCLKCP
jgi:transposase InsO family protein